MIYLIDHPEQAGFYQMIGTNRSKVRDWINSTNHRGPIFATSGGVSDPLDVSHEFAKQWVDDEGGAVMVGNPFLQRWFRK